MPCFSFVTSTSFTCCCSAVALEETKNQRQRQNRNGSCCLAKWLLLWISRCSYECWLLCPGRLEAEILSVAKRRRLDGLISGSMKLTPHLHGAKHFVGYSFLDIQICVLISSTSNRQVSFFIKQCFISEDCTFP